MKKCPDCRTAYVFSAPACPACGFRPATLEGFPAYAPELNRGAQAFSPELFKRLAAVEAGSFWFQARNRLIVQAIRAHGGRVESFLEIGCGTGYVLSGLRAAFPEARLCGSEISTDGLAFAAERLPGVSLMQMDALKIPFVQEFDGIGAFDVLEHIPEDEEVMGEVYAALKPNGFFALTVPQHRWLWSSMDEAAQHLRRYTGEELRRKLTGAGFKILYSTSFVSLLLPALMFSRLGSNKGVEACELVMAPWLKAICSGCMRLEEFCLRLGLKFPLGGSRLVVAQKKPSGTE